MGLGIEAGTALDLGDLAANVRDCAHAFAIHRRGVQAHEAALFYHITIGVDLANRHIVRVRRAVHTARMRRLGEREQRRLAQVGDGVVFDAQVVLAQASAQQLGQAQERILVVNHLATLVVGCHLELFVAQESEMVVHQPLEEAFDFRALIFGAERVLVDQGQHVADLGLHRQEIAHGHAHLGQHLLQLAGQQVELGSIGAAVDFQVHQRLLQHALALGALGQDFQQLALAATAHAEHGGLQGMDAVPAAVQLGADRVHQKRQVVVQYFDGRVGRLPAVTLVIGVVHANLGLGVVETLQHAPGRQGATGQVGKPALGKFVQRDDAEELLGEQRHLWQCLFTDVLRQGRLQLVLVVGFAGCGEERHLWYSAWALYLNEASRASPCWIQR
ncbi:hypothetical protein D9M71_366140 [compost metagenome]